LSRWFASDHRDPDGATLDAYLTLIIVKLGRCREPERVRDLLAEADLVVSMSGLTGHSQRAFWHSLTDALDVVAQEPPTSDAPSMAIRDAVIAAARNAIIEYQAYIADDGETPRHT
jgi:hypothetical protein